MEKNLNQMLQNHQKLHTIKKELDSVCSRSRRDIENLMKESLMGKKIKIELIRTGAPFVLLLNHPYNRDEDDENIIYGVLENVAQEKDDDDRFSFEFVREGRLITNLSNIGSITMIT